MTMARCWLWCSLAAALLTSGVAAAAVLVSETGDLSAPRSFVQTRTHTSSRANVHPKYARVNGGAEVLWQRPTGDVKGVFFVAHGCKHQAPDYWSFVSEDGWHFEACSKTYFGHCLGLPEERRIREAALARGYLVVGVSGGSGIQSCWYDEADAPRVAAAIRHVLAEEGLPADTEVTAMGASSGGSFMGRLAAPVAEGGLPHLKCIVPMIQSIGGYPGRSIPTMFVHMPRDSYTAQAVQYDLQELKAKGVRTAELRADPLPVTEEYMRRCLAADVAKDVVSALHNHGLLNSEGFLKKDPRSRSWVDTTMAAIAGRSQDTLVPDESCISELMNVAFAQHEQTAQYIEQQLDFCEGTAAGVGSA